MMLTPATLRAMRGALNWSMRDLAAEAGIAVGTVLTMENGKPVSTRSIQRVRRAFRLHGVSVRQDGPSAVVRIGPPPVPAQNTPDSLRELPYVVVRQRVDGTHRVLFEVPARIRPPAWPATRPLPVNGRTGRLDADEVVAIRADAAKMLADLHAARTLACENRFGATVNRR